MHFTVLVQVYKWIYDADQNDIWYGGSISNKMIIKLERLIMIKMVIKFDTKKSIFEYESRFN